MGKLRRPEKNSVHPLPLYAGRKTREVPTKAAEVLAKAQAEEQISPEEVTLLLEEMSAAIADASSPEPVAVTTNEDLRDVVAGLRYVGPKKAQVWQQTQSGLQIAEAKRLGQHRKDFTKRDWIPELYGKGALTAEGLKGYQDLVGMVFAEGVAYLDGVEGLEEADRTTAEAQSKGTEFTAEIVEFLEGLDFAEQLRLMAKVISLQTLRRSQTFPAAHPGHVEAGGRADA